MFFVIRRPDELDYEIRIEAGRSSWAPVAADLPAIGVGDPLFHNSDTPRPPALGGMPQLTDLEGNGVPHLTAGTHWSTYHGWPHNVILHRLGRSRRGETGGDRLDLGPVSALRVRTRPGGELQMLSEDFYVRHQMIDWDGDGRRSLVTVNSGAREVKFFRNTGEPGPIFDLVHTYAAQETSGYLGVQMVDLRGNGRLDLIVGGNEQLPGREKDPYTSYIQWYENLGSSGAAPRFGSPRRLALDDGGQIRFEGCGWNFVFADLDGDGRPDLLYARDRHEQPLVWYRNLGMNRSSGVPLFRLEGPPAGLEPVPNISVSLGWASCGTLEGPIVHGKVYADWDGHGIPDLVVGNETNRLFWFRNEGSRKRPEFGEMQQIEVEQFAESPEKREETRRLCLQDVPNAPYPFQETEPFFWRQKVAVVDWNGDGLPDLVAVDGEGYYRLFERFREGDGPLRLRKGPGFVYEDGRPVTHESLPRETSGTDGIVVCDWQNRGVWDILVGTCYAIFYLENRGSKSRPRFARPVKLSIWGTEIRHSRHGLLGDVVDWDGDGRLSWLAGSESGMYFLFRRSALDAPAPPRGEVRVLPIR